MKQTIIYIIILWISLPLFFQNCQRHPTHFNLSEASQIPSTENLAQSGDANVVYIFPKTPLNSKLTLPAYIESDSGFLKNDMFNIKPKNEILVQKSLNDSDWPLRIGSFFFIDLAQYNSFFWANRTSSIILERTGIFYLQNNPITIETNSNKTGWSSSEKTIYLQKEADLDTGLLVYFIGQANLEFSQVNFNRNNYDLDSQQIDCGPDGSVYKKDCCSSKMGCSKAILSGISDYFVGMIFENNPTLGEYITQRSSGLGFCEISRDLNANLSLDLQAAYDACFLPNLNSRVHGQINVMGSWYASIWWRVRAILPTDSDRKSLDRLFMLHLQVVLPIDNFQSIFQKINELDKTNFNGNFSNYFAAALGNVFIQ
jgi:hypothetical protein